MVFDINSKKQLHENNYKKHLIIIKTFTYSCQFYLK